MTNAERTQLARLLALSASEDINLRILAVQSANSVIERLKVSWEKVLGVAAQEDQSLDLTKIDVVLAKQPLENVRKLLVSLRSYAMTRGLSEKQRAVLEAIWERHQDENLP